MAAHPLGRRVQHQQLGMFGLDPAQLVEQSVVNIVADLGVVEVVVAVGRGDSSWGQRSSATRSSRLSSTSARGGLRQPREIVRLGGS